VEKQNKKAITDKLNQMRMPKQQSRKSALVTALTVFASGIILGIISKWLDNLELDSTVWWHRAVEAFDPGNFFSGIAVWLLIALIIAVFSFSPLRAALNVFVFFVGMCVAYHLYTVVFSGFNPFGYMMIWYGITLLSPFLAVLCWYAKGVGIIPTVIDVCIIAVFFLSCFSIGFIYMGFRGILYSAVFIGAAVILYNNPKQTAISLAAALPLSFLLSPVWPFE
jgi:hypothetical protein